MIYTTLKTLLRENTVAVPAAAATKILGQMSFQIDQKWLNFASEFHDSYKPPY